MNRPRCIYLCGPRSGTPDTNIPLFSTVADALRGMGYQVINPVDVNMAFLGVPYSPSVPGQPTYPGLRADIFAMLSCCDGIALLPKWRDSVGCRPEVGLAITFRYQFVDWQTGEVIRRPEHVIISHGYHELPNNFRWFAYDHARDKNVLEDSQ